MIGAVAFVLWCLSVAIAWIEGWALAWVVVGIGLGDYARRVQIHAAAEIRYRDRVRRWEASR